MKKRGEKANSCFKSVFNSIRLSHSKRSQAAVFIVFAVIIIAVIGITYFLNKNLSQSDFSEDYKAKLNIVLGSIETCEIMSADNSVIRIGLQGGYNKPPETYLDLGWTFIPYYFIEDKTYLPDKTKIGKELGERFDENLKQCLGLIHTQGFKLKLIPSKTSVQISEKLIKFNVGMKVILTKSNSVAQYDLKNEPIVRNYKLNDMYEVAKYITDSHNKNPPLLCMDCLVKIANEKKLFIDYINLDKTTKIITISEAFNETSQTSDFAFQFIEKYKDSETSLIPKVIKNA